MFMFMLNYPDLDSDLSSLRCCTVGGQTMPVPKMEEVEARFGCPLIELWGMTSWGTGHHFRIQWTVSMAHWRPLPYVEARIASTEDTTITCPQETSEN